MSSSNPTPVQSLKQAQSVYVKGCKHYAFFDNSELSDTYGDALASLGQCDLFWPKWSVRASP